MSSLTLFDDYAIELECLEYLGTKMDAVSSRPFERIFRGSVIHELGGVVVRKQRNFGGGIEAKVNKEKGIDIEI